VNSTILSAALRGGTSFSAPALAGEVDRRVSGGQKGAVLGWWMPALRHLLPFPRCSTLPCC